MCFFPTPLDSNSNQESPGGPSVRRGGQCHQLRCVPVDRDCNRGTRGNEGGCQEGPGVQGRHECPRYATWSSSLWERHPCLCDRGQPFLHLSTSAFPTPLSRNQSFSCPLGGAGGSLWGVVGGSLGLIAETLRKRELGRSNTVRGHDS